tara:strand:+ start:99 stop:4082 length:3984 start_codon:yes stop_codon:yes gene_type:complete
MATTLTKTVFNSTFKDDFADSAGFHRILFNSGKALQARELTQLQTILQNQIQRFGDNIFKEGAVVKPGGANINPKYEFVKLDTTTNTLPTDASSITTPAGNANLFLGATSNIQVKVLQVVTATGSDPDTLYVQYMNTVATSGTTTPRLTAGENITNGSVTLTVQATNTTANPATGVGILATLASGIYYARGHFVFTEDQSKIISKYSDDKTTNLGFKSVEDIVTSIDDNSLFDNQGATPNLTAPGADRYRIKLTIAEESDVDSDENFIHVATIKKGQIFSAVSTNDAFNIPADVVAKRIFENSGDYIVKPFTVKFELDSALTHLNLNVSSGTAVVDGFRASTTFPTTLRVKKPNSTVTINNDVTPVDFDNSVIVNTDSDGATEGLPDINTFPKLNLRNAHAHAGSTIGTARVKAINHFDNKLKYHLFDIQMNSGQAFRNVKSIGTGSSEYFNVELENGKAVLKEPFNNSLLFPTSKARPKAITDISFAVQRRFTTTANGSGQASISLSATGETFTNTSDWIIGTDSAVLTPSTLFDNPTIGGNGSTASTITGLPANQNVEILAYVNKSSPSIKTKTLTTRTEVLAGGTSITLGKADAFDIIEVIKAGDSNTDRTKIFTLDNGQRDNHYDLAKITLNPGLSAVDSCQVKYRYFEHGVSGDFFAVNSYTGQVTYDKIPRFTTSQGIKVNLRNFLDFRSVKGAAGEFDNSGTGSRVIEVPQPGTLITSDNEYFLPQAGKLVINREGVINFIHGMPSFNPNTPNRPDQSLGLYDIFMGANTDNDSDVRIEKIDHRRFTMKDIGRLEKRISNLEDVTSLSLLEIDTKYFQTLDSSGNDRTKSGFFVDNFVDHTFTDLRKSVGHRAAIDPVSQHMRPAFLEDNVRLMYDSASSTNTIKKGDNVYLHYDEAPYINQNEATKAVFLNPFAVVIYEGLVTLSPASDEWRDTTRLPDKIVHGGTRLATNNANNWNNWSWSWGGIPVENLEVGSSTNTQRGVVNRVVSEETVLDLIEDRVLQTAFLPFMRSRKVNFKIQGMRPNTQLFPILDGINISSLAREEPFTFYSDNDSDFGNTLNNLTTHPDGTNTLTTDNDGNVEGSLIIPNNNTTRIRVGTKQLKFLDISVDKEENAGSIARASYSAVGFLDTKEATFLSTRQLNVQGFKVPPPRYYEYEGGETSDDDGPNGGPGSGGSHGMTDDDAVGIGNGNSPNGNGTSGPSGAGTDEAPGDNSTYICTATFNNGFISNNHFANLRRYGVNLRRTDPYLMRAYDWFGPKIAKTLGNKYTGVFLTNYYKAKQRKEKLTLSQLTFDVISRTTLRPLGRVIGKILTMKKGN